MKLLIWDFDGTLAYREGMWSQAFADVARAHIPGCQATRETFLPHLRTGFYWHHWEIPHTHITTADDWWYHLFPIFQDAFVKALGITRDQAAPLVPAVRHKFVDPQHWKLFDDTLPCLQTLTQQGWTHVILSNHVPELPHLIEALGLTPHVSRIYNSATLGYEKPHPKSFTAVLAAYPTATTKIMIGDNYKADIEGATTVGLPSILVRVPNSKAPNFHETLTHLSLTLQPP